MAGMGWTGEPWSEELEEEATRRLREAGAFRRGTGTHSPRSEAERRRRTNRWEDWMDEELVAGNFEGELVECFAALATGARLSPLEAQVLFLCRVEGRSRREAAARLGVTVYRIHCLTSRAVRKCRRAGLDLPATPRSLFWEEIRRKRAATYRRPFHGARAREARNRLPRARRSDGEGS